MAKKSKPAKIDFAMREKMLADIQKYTLFHDTFMNVVLSDTKACQHVLRVITGNTDLEIVEVEVQYSLKSTSTRNAILDVLAKDVNGCYYNIELQNSDTIDHARRVRLYQSLFGASFTPRGADFSDVPQLVSIYLSKTDFWKKGRTVYKVKSILEDTEVTYDDGCKTIFVNAAVNDGSDIAKLMKYFVTADPNDDSQGELSKRVKYLKLDEGGQNEMCEIAKKYYTDGHKNGADEARFEIFSALVAKNGLPIEQALEIALVPSEDHARFVEMYNEAQQQ